jgi:chromosome condensin MukBEF ATPase and DNA-binding subunit MukB
VKEGKPVASNAVNRYTARMSSVRRTFDILREHLSLQHADYLELQRTAKLLDRSLAKVFQHIEPQLQVLEEVYRYIM